MTERKVKRLAPNVLKEIEAKNHARRLANLSIIRIKVRSCLRCSELFESAGHKECGCRVLEPQPQEGE